MEPANGAGGPRRGAAAPTPSSICCHDKARYLGSPKEAGANMQRRGCKMPTFHVPKSRDGHGTEKKGFFEPPA